VVNGPRCSREPLRGDSVRRLWLVLSSGPDRSGQLLPKVVLLPPRRPSGAQL